MMNLVDHENEDERKVPESAPAANPADQRGANITEELAKLQLDNDKLSSQLKEVKQMNTHWQRYDTQREAHVLKLSTTNTDLQQNVSSLSHQLREQQAVVADMKGRHDGIPRDKQADTINDLTETNQKLKEKILDLEIEKASRKKEGDDQLTITMLREQIHVCIGDFKEERTDRERIHAENERLRERLARSEQRVMQNNEQIYVYQEQIKRLQEHAQVSPSRPAPMNIHDEEFYYPAGRQQNTENMVPAPSRRAFRHPLNLEDDLILESKDEIDIDGTKDDSEDQIDGNTNDDTEILECPGCLAPFGINMHAELLDHINTCLH